MLHKGHTIPSNIYNSFRHGFSWYNAEQWSHSTKKNIYSFQTWI